MQEGDKYVIFSVALHTFEHSTLFIVFFWYTHTLTLHNLPRQDHSLLHESATSLMRPVSAFILIIAECAVTYGSVPCSNAQCGWESNLRPLGSLFLSHIYLFSHMRDHLLKILSKSYNFTLHIKPPYGNHAL